jgi:hypothetical protein
MTEIGNFQAKYILIPLLDFSANPLNLPTRPFGSFNLPPSPFN